MRLNKLTARKVDKLTRPGRYGDGGGLTLQVQSAANKSWLFRYERDGKERWMGLGPVGTISLKDARERARRCRVMLLDGLDPLEEKRRKQRERALAAARAMDFETAARTFYRENEPKWKNRKAAAQFLSTMETYVFPKIGGMAVGDIETGDVLRVLEQPYPDQPETSFWKAIPHTANRVRSRIERVLDWSAVRGHRTGENPARWKGHLEHTLPGWRRLNGGGTHHPALPYERVPAFMAALRAREGVAARALEFLALAACRTGDIIGSARDGKSAMLWTQVDLEKRVWTIPSTKTEVEHRVPLSDRAVEILGGLPREADNPHVFISVSKPGDTLSNAAMAKVVRTMQAAEVKAGREGWIDPKENGRTATPHGFRSTFRDWAAEQTAYPNHVVEQALAHAIGSSVEAAYRRGDLFAKRKRLMDAWAKYCTSPAAGGTVVPMRKAAAE